MAKQQIVYLLLGSNIEPRIDYLARARRLVYKELGVVEMESLQYESEPWGFDSDTNFLNQVLQIRTNLEANELLEKSQQIEQQLGRIAKTEKGYQSRVIDIDLLYYGDEVISEPALQVPHPQIQFRRFTLIPLAEVAPEMKHPVLKKTNLELLDACQDEGKVWKLFNEHLHEV